jgi:DNA-binding GntR family transcriptional regulator
MIVANSLPEIAYEKLKWAIIKGELASNTSISERKFSEKYGISRTPLREALARLGQDGFVLNYPNLGYIVAPITFKDIIDIFDVRLCIESFALTQICEYKIPVDSDLLRKINSEYFEAGKAGDDETLIIKNVEFHKVAVDSLKNTYISNIYNQTRDMILRLAFASNKVSPVVTVTGYQEHEGIIQCLEGYKLAEGIKEASLHLKKGRDNILEAAKGTITYL